MKPDVLQKMQQEDQIARALNIIHTIFNHLQVKWFISFGSLLYFIRDRNMGVNFEQDFDVSVLGECDYNRVIEFMGQWSFEVKRRILDDQTKEPLQLVFKSKSIHFVIDVYFWRKYNGYWWHTYDYYGEHPKNGKPSKYVFKGTPKDAMSGEPWKYNWEEITGDINFPKNYGTLLDIWYPGWFVPDANFGQSKAEKKITVKNCKHLDKELK